MKIVIAEQGRMISSREFARVWPMQHKHVLTKIDEVLDIFPEFSGSNFRPAEYRDAQGKGRREFLMDWEGFWHLATSCSGPRAIRARAELISTVKRALSNEHTLQAALAATEERLRAVEAQARILMSYAKGAASEAGRALSEWRSAKVAHGEMYRELEAAGQLVLNYPDPRILGDGEDAA